MVGRSLASLALGLRRRGAAALAFVDPPPLRVPPEPFRYLGGSMIRRAILGVRRRSSAASGPAPLTAAVAGIPERIGIHIGR